MSTLVNAPVASSGEDVFDIEDPRLGCVVQQGAMDLFLVPLDEVDRPGARFHILRAGEGRMLLGMGNAVPHRFRLMAIPTPNTSCHVFQIQEALNREALQHGLESWILGLVVAFAENPAGSAVKVAQAGQTVSAGDQGGLALTRKGVIWVHQQQGTACLLGRQALVLAPGDPAFPLTRQGWLLMEPGAVLRCESEAESDVYQRLAGVQHFHGLALEVFLAKRERILLREQERLAMKQASDRSRLNASLYQLGSVLDTSLGQRMVEPTYADPLLQVCDIVGRASGIDIRPHPDMLLGAKVADPLEAIARASNIRIRRVALRDSWWKGDNGNLVAFRDVDRQPLALVQKQPRGYNVFEAGSQTPVLLTQAEAEQLSPFAYLFYRPFPSRAMSLRDLVGFGLFGTERDFWLVAGVGTAAGLMGMIPPYATGIIFNDLIPGAERRQLLETAGLLIAVTVSTTMFTLTRGFTLLRIEGRMDVSLQAALWDRLLRLPASFFRQYSSGDLAQRSLGVAQIRRTLTGSTLTAVFSLIFSIFSFALLFYYSWRLALFATLLVAVAVIVSLVCGWVQIRPQRELFEVRGRLSGLLLQLITGISKFRVASAETRAFVMWSRLFSRQKDLYRKVRLPSNALLVFNAVYPTVCLGLLFFVNTFFLHPPKVKLLGTGDLIAFLAAFAQFLLTMLQVSSALIVALSVLPLYERAQPIFSTLPEVDTTKSDPGKLSGEIEISDVSFRYRPDLPLVLRGISLQIRPGQFVAFVGASGGGKSTLLRLLLGFESPESGAIYYDGHDLAGLDAQAVRRQLGVVLQTSQLVSGDIFTNIVGSSALNVADAWQAAKMAGLEADIKRMPMGMHTIVGEGGGGISGGQRQRLMIARAIVAKPRILIFDEATSALDNETQRTVSASLEGLQVTRIVIAHRLSTILNADRIYVLGDGVIRQSGTYEELLEQGDLFGELIKRQLA